MPEVDWYCRLERTNVVPPGIVSLIHTSEATPEPALTTTTVYVTVSPRPAALRLAVAWGLITGAVMIVVPFTLAAGPRFPALST